MFEETGRFISHGSRDEEEPGGQLEIEAPVGDELAIRSVLEGNKEDFRLLVEAYKDRVVSVIFKQVRNHAVAEELAQETFIRAYRSLKGFKGEAAFSTWLIRIAINQCSSYFSSSAYRKTLKRADLSAASDRQGSDGRKDIEQRQKFLAFSRAMSQLKPLYREVLVLCALEGKSYQEVSGLMNVPEGTVKSRLNKARLLLKRNLEMSGWRHDE